MKQVKAGTSKRKRRLKPVVGPWLALRPEAMAKLMAGLAVDCALGSYTARARFQHRGRTLVIELTERKR